MRISTKGRHAVMAMVDFATHGKEKPVPLADVAQRQMISLSYLEQLVAKLKKNGLVKSMRGPGGGYLLAHPSNVTTIHQIVLSVDTASAKEKTVPSDTQAARKMTDYLWQKMSEEVQKFLKSVTLEDVIQRKI